MPLQAFSNLGKMNRELIGFLYGLAAYGFWGILPVYWKQFPQVSSAEVLCHRIFWCFGFTGILLFFDRALRKQWRELEIRQIKSLILSAVCIGVNWLIFVWAVQTNQIVDASLGYFICPLMMAAIGVLVLKEKLNHLQYFAIFLAGMGVLWLTVQFGSLPWIGLGLAFTFSIYSLLRKTSGLNSLHGLFLETMILSIPSLIYFIYLKMHDSLYLFHHTRYDDLLLVGAGIVTALPLWWFAHAAGRLQLATLGLMQYIAPILQFLVGVVLYQEVFSQTHQIGFSLIWCGLALYIYNQVRTFGVSYRVAA